MPGLFASPICKGNGISSFHRDAGVPFRQSLIAGAVEEELSIVIRCMSAPYLCFARVTGDMKGRNVNERANFPARLSWKMSSDAQNCVSYGS